MSQIITKSRLSLLAAVTIAAMVGSAPAMAEPLGYAGPFGRPMAQDPVLRDAGLAPDADSSRQISPRLRRTVVEYPTREPNGTVVIDTPNTYLYLVLGGGKAIRYGIGVGREGFTWSGVKSVERKAEWPDWIPPVEMIQRQPYLPRFMAGGPGNPLGARAMYLAGTVYRIHGTNDPSTIGKRVSSGCIRLVNDDVIDLYQRVNVGTKVVVLPMQPARSQSVAAAPAARNAIVSAAPLRGLY
jgi:lipoprotein-anchoring transpeptidase ErfK/SrfK